VKSAVLSGTRFPSKDFDLTVTTGDEATIIDATGSRPLPRLFGLVGLWKASYLSAAGGRSHTNGAPFIRRLSYAHESHALLPLRRELPVLSQLQGPARSVPAL